MVCRVGLLVPINLEFSLCWTSLVGGTAKTFISLPDFVGLSYLPVLRRKKRKKISSSESHIYTTPCKREGNDCRKTATNGKWNQNCYKWKTESTTHRHRDQTLSLAQILNLVAGTFCSSHTKKKVQAAEKKRCR